MNKNNFVNVGGYHLEKVHSGLLNGIKLVRDVGVRIKEKDATPPYSLASTSLPLLRFWQ